MQESTMRDSGERRKFETGAVRDRGDFKPRPDLISPHANLREGAWLERGARKYSIDNWTKGMPIRECVASLARHLEAYKLGLCDEDHMAAIRTNAGFILHYEEEIKAGRLPASLDDMPRYVDRGRPIPTVGIADDRDGGLAAPFAGTPTFNGVPMQMVPDLSHVFTVYLCGPITGQKVDNVWRDAATAFLKGHGIKTLDPLRGKKHEDISHLGLGYKGQLAAPEIAERDRMDIEEADVVLAHFPYEPPRQSIGSLMEIGAAAIGFKKPVILSTNVPVFGEHLFCRNFCTLEPDFGQALNRIVALAHVHQEKR
jgi:nucleoside 2-deoxyribosyltransferase